MDKINTIDLLKYISGASAGVIIYNLIFHNDDSYISILLRGLVVGSITGIIFYLIDIKYRK